MDLKGFKEEGHRLRNVTFDDVQVPDNSRIVINNAEKITFTGVKSATGSKPNYVLTNTERITY